MVSCKAPSLTPTEKIELPKFYMDRETDSTTISSMSWKTFFPDTLLQSYIAEALNNNHSFLQTIERISIARSQVRVGKGALLPDLSLGIDVEYNVLASTLWTELVTAPPTLPI